MNEVPVRHRAAAMNPTKLPAMIYVGCSGWNVHKDVSDHFSRDGSHLQRYAARLNCVEVNSSFYCSHRRTTYQRWARETPDEFRFSVKMPRHVTHERRLQEIEEPVTQFFAEIASLGSKLGAVLVQLPPSLAFDLGRTDRFFGCVRSRIETPIVCEPRHVSWFGAPATDLLSQYQIGRVAADPCIVAAAAEPDGSRQIVYFRWHGSPKMYYSSYADARLKQLADSLLQAARHAGEVWCVFDNTAEGASVRNALHLSERLNAAMPSAK